MTDRFRLDGQVAVVTAGGRGIGRGIALCLAEAGADVVVTSRTQADLDEVVARVEAFGRRGLGLTGDATRAGDMAAVAEMAVERFGKLTLWVNNAGGQPDNLQRPFSEVSQANFDAQLALNLGSVWAGVRAAQAHMIAGSIINISSRAARTTSHSGHGLYAAAKAAVNNLTATLGAEMGPSIRVNAVAPGPVLTETFYETMGLTPDEAQARLPGFGIPLQRFGQPEDIGDAVVFLASPAASWISGQCLWVTGGA
jgi:7-alpha-hydroxysteroid dehydrogenase